MRQNCYCLSLLNESIDAPVKSKAIVISIPAIHLTELSSWAGYKLVLPPHPIQKTLFVLFPKNIKDTGSHIFVKSTICIHSRLPPQRFQWLRTSTESSAGISISADPVTIPRSNQSLIPSLLQSPIIRIQSGTPGYELHIHKKLLCHNIPVFRSLLQYEVEVLPMRAWSKDCLNLLWQWLYQDRLTYTIVDGLPHSVPILDLYFLGLELGAVRLRNLAIDHLRRICNKLCVIPEAVNIEDIYRKTERTSPIRLLMARMVAHFLISCDPEKDTETCKEYLGLAEKNGQFRVDFATAMKYVIITQIADPAEGDDAIYHERDVDGSEEHPRDMSGATVQQAQEGRVERASSIERSTPPPAYSRYP